MQRTLFHDRRGLTLVETLAVLVAAVISLAFLMPVLGLARNEGAVMTSKAKLRILHRALMCYANDWDDRQFTAVPDDLGEFAGSHCSYAPTIGCYPPLIGGWSCDGGLYAYWQDCPGIGGNNCNPLVTFPISFQTEFPVGTFRLPNHRPLHDYVNGRVYDPAWYSPLDTKAWNVASTFFDVDCEFPGVQETGFIVPASFVLSPAAMYNPAVFRAPSQGGFQHPDTLDDGYASPTVSQARYADLKTWMLEHNWLRHPPAECNPEYDDLYGGYSQECDPYLFNHGGAARPMALYYDGSVEQLRTGHVATADRKLIQQTGEGLWSRDTPYGETGYFGDASFDGTNVSHHILTLDGILGRDRLPDEP